VIIDPIALVAAPLAVCLAVPRPSRRDVIWMGGLAGLVALGLTAPSDGFERLAHGWVVLLTGSLVSVFALGRRRSFVPVGLTAVAGAAVAAALLLPLTGRSWGEVVWLAERHFGALMRQMIGAFAALAATTNGAAAATTIGTLDAYGAGLVRVISRLFAGLVLLQSLASIALAWALYHRIAREPKGEPLGPLAAFRFNDHLIWGVSGSLLLLVFPHLGWLNALGGNLLVFFGGLYVLRGVAVFSAVTAGRLGGPLAVFVATFIALLLWPVSAPAALAVGLTDTLMDWRRRLARTPQQP